MADSGVRLGQTDNQEPLEDYKARIRKEERDAAEKHYKELQLVWQAKDLADLEQKMDQQVQIGLEKMFEKWKADQKPLSKEQIEQLVQQEYVTFSVKLQIEQDSKDGNPATVDGYVSQEFTIRELPQSVEQKFYRTFKTQLQDHLPELNALTQKTMDKPVEEKLKAILELVDGGFGVMAELVSMILDPRKKKGITKEWVQENVSSMRQWNIIQAQVEANRLRDFFLQLSQSGQTIQTMTQPPSYQALLQQLQ